MDRADVARWLDEYVEAWRTYDRDRITALFTEDVEYRYHPYDEPIAGRNGVVESWLGEGEHEDASSRDEEGTYDASYAPVAVEGRRNRLEHLLREPGRPGGQRLRELLRDAVLGRRPLSGIHRVVHQTAAPIASSR